MRSNYKSSISSRATVKLLIVACMPAPALAFVVNLSAPGEAFTESAHQGLTVDDNTSSSTNGPATKVPSTNHSGRSTNGDRPPVYPTEGIRG